MNTSFDSTSTHQDLTSLIGHPVYDAEGNKIGTAGNIYHSDASGEPEWVTVKTGMFGTKESFVPLSGATGDDKGLHVAVLKDSVKDAPRIDEDGHLSDTETAELYRHYGLTPGSAAMSGQAGQTDKTRGGVPPQGTEMGRESMGRDNAAARPAAGAPTAQATGTAAQAAGMTTTKADFGTTPRQSIIRSEERLHASTEAVESGRVKLRKYIVTTQQKITVPIRHEEVHVTREPVKPGEAGTSIQIGEEEREVILHEERPIVAKEIVAVERVSIDTEIVQENREVSDTVRREEIEVDDGTKRPRS
jgi:uncharacterized protein (TIGR02271 family)